MSDRKITRAISELLAGNPQPVRDLAAKGELPTDAPIVRRAYELPLDQCQHVQCRANENRQDLQCQRLGHGPETRHLHTIALGFCDPRYAHLKSVDGHAGGHVHPIHRI